MYVWRGQVRFMIVDAGQREDLLLESFGEGFMVRVAAPECCVILVDHNRFQVKRE